MQLAATAIPGSMINSMMNYYKNKLGLDFRGRLTHYFHEKYLDDIVYYQIGAIDRRITHPD